MSHPMRVRGLKLDIPQRVDALPIVAPHAGAWIEMFRISQRQILTTVAPHAGAWIEIGEKGATYEKI